MNDCRCDPLFVASARVCLLSSRPLLSLWICGFGAGGREYSAHLVFPVIYLFDHRRAHRWGVASTLLVKMGRWWYQGLHWLNLPVMLWVKMTHFQVEEQQAFPLWNLLPTDSKKRFILTHLKWKRFIMSSNNVSQDALDTLRIAGSNRPIVLIVIFVNLELSIKHLIWWDCASRYSLEIWMQSCESSFVFKASSEIRVRRSSIHHDGYFRPKHQILKSTSGCRGCFTKPKSQKATEHRATTACTS